MYRQIAAARLGIAPEELRFIEGDTDAVACGAGTRRLALGGDRRHARSGSPPTR